MQDPERSSELQIRTQALLARATRHHTTFQGSRTVWHAWGRQDDEPVVLLHGGSGSWTHWIRNIDTLLSAGRRVWAPDLPGCGDSDRPAQGEDADALVDPLAHGLDELLAGRGFDLVGFSFGGLVGGLMAARPPAGLRRLVLVGAPVIALPKRRVQLIDWRPQADPVARAAAHRANLAAIMLHRPESITDFAVDLHAANVVRDRLRRRRLSQTDVLARALATVRVPIVGLYGREDAFYRDHFDAIVASLAALPALAWQQAIADAGHWVQFEAPQAFDEALARALAVRVAA